VKNTQRKKKNQDQYILFMDKTNKFIGQENNQGDQEEIKERTIKDEPTIKEDKEVKASIGF